ncbi:MAG: DsbC family protein [Gammaproteobacteria bacterium]|nr:DsbC family protein [Gammaproteobacteria bacterium]
MTHKSMAAGLLGFLWLGVIAPAMPVEDTTKLKAALATLLPGTTPDSIKPSAIPGMYEIGYGATVLYMTLDGRYLLQGDLIDVERGENLTEVNRSQARLKIVSAIDENSMIVYAPKQVKHTITVFTDPDCAYCRKMHGEMPAYNKQGIKMRYLAFPRSGVDTPSYEKSVSVWCAKDRAVAMTRAKRGEEMAKKTCDDPVQIHLQAARKIGISGTPTLILEDGSLIPGYVPPERLAEILGARTGG